MEFQTNTTVEFNRHTDLLEKANSNRPHLIYQTVKPARLVDIVADSSSALGYTAKEAKQSLAKLPLISLERVIVLLSTWVTMKSVTLASISTHVVLLWMRHYTYTLFLVNYPWRSVLTANLIMEF